jgi:hypothetical protein
MRFPGQYVLAGALIALPALVGCSKKEAEAPPAPAVEQAEVPQASAPAQSTPTVQIANVQQVNANWDAVSKDIASQNYDNAVRAWIAMDQAQRQAKMNEAMRAEYLRRAYQAQEALRQKAETDAKAREAYQALGRVMMGR